MLRLAIWYENRMGRNDGNPLYVWRVLKRMQAAGQLEVDHLVPYDKELHRFGTYDLHLWVDWGEDGLVGTLPYQPIYPPGRPLVYWASDTHLGYDYRLQCAKQADLVFCAQSRAVEEFRRDGVTATWLPHAVEPEAYPDFHLASKKYDVCFVGHVNAPNRVALLDTAFRAFPNFFYGQRLFEQAARKYAESKVCLNMSHVDDVNMRVFEVLATGSFLVTNALPQWPGSLTPGTHFATYATLEDVVPTVQRYLEDEDTRERMARVGQAEVLAHHTMQHRVEIMLNTATERGLIPQEELWRPQLV